MTVMQSDEPLIRSGEYDLQGLAEELRRQQSTKLDVVADTRRMSLASGALGRSVLAIDSEHEVFAPVVNDYCHGQISDRLGVPKKYYDRMRIDAPELLDRNVNHWLAQRPETRMVRMLDGRARAFLSDRYRRLDNLDLMEHVLPTLGTMPGLQFHISGLTDLRLYARFVLPSLSAEIRVGDVVQAGVAIRNSEVGAGALAVEPFLLRLVCLNGMTTPVGRMRKYHVGSRVEEEETQFYAEATLNADDAAFFMKVNDLVRAALSEVQFEQVVAGLREAADAPKMRDVPEGTRILGQRFSLTEGEQASILTHLIEGGDLTQWGAANAITAAAKQVDDFDRRVDLEAIGGDLVMAPREEWRKIAAAV